MSAAEQTQAGRSHADFLSRFPALRRLGPVLQRRVPVVQQLMAADCGAACLGMVLGYHGKAVRVEEVRDVIGIARDGASAHAILSAARYYGLRGRGARVDIDDLEYLAPGAILHWEFAHFVVFERLAKDGVDIVDPALGRRRVSMQQFRRSFTGVVLLLEPGEAFARGRAAGGHLLPYLRQVISHSSRWSRILVTSILLQLFGLAVPILTGALVDRVVPRSDYHLLFVLCAGLISLVLFFFLMSLIRAHLLLQLRTLVDVRMTLGFVEHMVSLPFAFFQRRSAGDLMMRMNSNATIREILTSGTLSGLLDGTLVTVYLGIVFFVQPAMGWLIMTLGLLQVLVFALARRRQAELMSRDLHTQARAQDYQVEMLAGIQTLKAAGGEQHAVGHWSDLFVDVLNVSLERGRLGAVVDTALSTLRLASPLLILGFGAYKVLGGEMSLGTMLGLSALAGGFLLPLASLVTTAGQLQLLRSYTERIDDVLRAEPEQDPARVRPAARLRGEIALEDVSFRYGPLSPLVVRDVTVSIQPGELVAIVGRSGSGKTTLANLLLGLYAPTTGRIRYDGADLSELDLTTVRRQVGIVSQDPYIFSGTIRANIALTEPGLPMPEVEAAAIRARIYDDIAAMPMRYETLLTDRGASLSGGQRQRLALARALAHTPSILFLDEATSALDAITEGEVQAELAALSCTKIVIAHRLSTIVNAHLILVMADGRVVEQGTHAELLKSGGEYAKLVAAQLTA